MVLTLLLRAACDRRARPRVEGRRWIHDLERAQRSWVRLLAKLRKVRKYQRLFYNLGLRLHEPFPDTRAILTWARTQDEEITLIRLRDQLVEGVTLGNVQEFNRQPEVVLGTLTMDTPGDIAMNSSLGSGLDMYRRLHGRLDPSDMVTSFRWLRQLMSTKPVAEVSDLIAAVERWEDQHRRYAARRDCTALTERQKMVSLLGLVPAELQSHLELNLPRLNSYDLLRREIVTFAENRRAFTVDDSGAMPMEVDYAKGKGQGKGKKETRKCHRCGKTGHLVKDCWSKEDIRRKDAGGSSGSGGNPGKPQGFQGKAEDTRRVRLKEVGAAVGVAKATPGSLKVKARRKARKKRSPKARPRSTKPR